MSKLCEAGHLQTPAVATVCLWSPSKLQHGQGSHHGKQSDRLLRASLPPTRRSSGAIGEVGTAAWPIKDSYTHRGARMGVRAGRRDARRGLRSWSAAVFFPGRAIGVISGSFFGGVLFERANRTSFKPSETLNFALCTAKISRIWQSLSFYIL
jgi:hypothetical protein